MRLLFAVLLTLVAVPARAGQSSFADIASDDELRQVRVWIERIKDQPANAAHEMSDFVRLIHGEEVIELTQIELKALDLLAHYLDLEAARLIDAAVPAHPHADVHRAYYEKILHPTSHLTRHGPLTAAARTFAMQLMRDLGKDRNDERRFILFRAILSGGRAFWTDHILEQVLVRSAPRYHQLMPLVASVRPDNFAAVAQAIAEHSYDFRFAQELLGGLISGRAVQTNQPLPASVGHVRCDQMLALATQSCRPTESE